MSNNFEHIYPFYRLHMDTPADDERYDLYEEGYNQLLNYYCNTDELVNEFYEYCNMRNEQDEEEEEYTDSEDEEDDDTPPPLYEEVTTPPPYELLPPPPY